MDNTVRVTTIICISVVAIFIIMVGCQMDKHHTIGTSELVGQ
jgi:hypothetical protein